MYTFKTEQLLPITIDTAWNFFSSPENLAKITPPEMDFVIVDNYKKENFVSGLIINYRVKPLLGIRLKWRTEICNVQHKKSFTDKQLIGPYKVWEHTHIFTETKDGLLMNDKINYELPYGYLGKIAHRIVVRNKIEAIFAYRKKMIEQLFSK